jgi:hypothetical protein
MFSNVTSLIKKHTFLFLLIAFLLGIIAGSFIGFNGYRLIEAAINFDANPLDIGQIVKIKLGIDSLESQAVNPREIGNNYDLKLIHLAVLDISIDSIYCSPISISNSNSLRSFKFFSNLGLTGFGKIDRDSIGRMKSVSFYSMYDTQLKYVFHPTDLAIIKYLPDNSISLFSSFYSGDITFKKTDIDSVLTYRVQDYKKKKTDKIARNLFTGNE